MASPKTIPALQEIEDITDSAYFVVDTGSVTKKIKKINLRKNLVDSIRSVSADTNLATTDDSVLVNTASGTIQITLPSGSTIPNGKKYMLKNIGGGIIQVNPSGSAKIFDDSLEDNFSMDIIGQSKTFHWNGTHWYVF